MLRIQRLSRPTKRSGVRIEPGEATLMRGIRVINQNKFSVWVDKFIPPAQIKSKKRKTDKE